MPLSSSEILSYDVVKPSNTALWSPVLHMICKDEALMGAQKHVVNSMLTNGFCVRQTLCCNLQADKQYKDLHNFLQKDIHEMKQSSIWLGISLLLAFKNKSFVILKALWSEQLAELWERKHLEMILDLCAQEQEWGVAYDILDSPLSRNIFVSYGENRHEFFKKYMEPLAVKKEGVDTNIMATSPYDSYFILSILDHHMFGKMTDYTAYHKVIKQVTNQEFERLSNEKKNEELFMGFLRYVNLQDPASSKKLEG